MCAAAASPNRLFYGDNLPVLREHIADESVDLVYLDPPFNSNRSYSVIFGKQKDDANAQIQAFDDTWHWTPETERLYNDILVYSPNEVADAITAFRTLLGENDAMAYLVMMAPRLVELHRVLKPTGSLYLHCDPTMSHYLKVLLDAIFGVRNFLNEVIWKRTQAHNSANRFGPQHDVILFYSKSSKYTWNTVYQDYDPRYVSEKFKTKDERGLYQDVSLTGPGTRQGESGKPWKGFNPTDKGRHWQIPKRLYDLYETLTGESLESYPIRERLDRADAVGIIHWPAKADGWPRFKQYLDISPGVVAQDLILDIDPINSRAAERLGYPTQKPLSLLERILQVSTNPGDVVLDPFCGCGTTVDAAQKLGRRWVGMDITYISIDLIIKRLMATFGQSVMDDVEVDGIPFDVQSAQRLFDQSPFDFERWAVSMIHAQPNEKQVGDRGIDGVRRFIIDNTTTGKVLVSVKGGKNVGPTMTRDLAGTVSGARDAQLGVMITLNDTLSKETQRVLDTAGYWTHPANGQSFPVLQHISVRQLMAGERPYLPTALAPYISAQRGVQLVDQGKLFG